jgi:HSP20 family protein
MTLTRWNPIRELATLEVDHLSRMFDAAFSGELSARGGWEPAADIFETANKDLVVKVELPDMKREDIKVTFENSVLAIEGERRVERDVKEGTGETYHRVERSHGAFKRTFTFPPSIDAAAVKATYENGLLTVTLPRREETRPRQIQVNG